jgi:uncharacterized protein
VNATPGKALISGSSGLIGAALCASLTASRYEVTRLVRGRSSGNGQVSWDPDKPLAPDSVSGFDVVVHLAGESIVGRWTEAKKAAIRDSRVQRTNVLAKALTEAPRRPRVFVSASATGFYGDRGEEILHEESSSGAGFLSEVCREWEAASKPAADAGIRTAHPRFGVVLSTAGGALAKMLLPFRLGLGGNIGNGRQWWSWIALQDAVGAIRHILETEAMQGAVNLVSPNPVTNAQLTKTLAAVLTRPAIFPMPAFVARLVLGEMADELLLSSQRVEPAKLVACGFTFRQPNLRNALEALLRS